MRMDCLVVKFMRLLCPNWAGPWWGKIPEWTASLGGRDRDGLALMDALQDLESVYVRPLYQCLGLLILSLV